MSTSGITFSGLASGLDTQAIIQALLAFEQRPIDALQNKKRALQSQLSLYGDFESKLKDLRDAAADIRKSTNFLEFKATTDRPEFLTASASASAIAGSYNVDVVALARAQSNQSGSYASDTDQLITAGAGSKLAFTVNGETTFDIDLSNATYSLQDVATAINAADEGVSAQVVKVDDGDYRLVVTGQLGEDAAFTVQGVGSADVVALGSGLSAGALQTAQDAELTINGLTIKRATNSISDAIQGVTLDLAAESQGTITQLTVTPDATATAGKVKSFVDKYNAVVDFVQAQNQLDGNGKPSSALFGDSTLRSVQSALRGILGSQVTTGNQSYELLAQVGIDSDRNGRLTFNQGEFETAVAADQGAVKALFTEAQTGIAARLYTQTDDYLDTVDGLLVARKNGFNDRIKDTDKQIQAGQARLARTQASLEQKYAALESLLGQLQSQGAALNGFSVPTTRK